MPDEGMLHFFFTFVTIGFEIELFDRDTKLRNTLFSKHTSYTEITINK